MGEEEGERGTPLILRRVYDQTPGPPKADHSRGGGNPCVGRIERSEIRHHHVEWMMPTTNVLLRYFNPLAPTPPEADLRSWGKNREATEGYPRTPGSILLHREHPVT